jgi:hypothetical protein
MVGELGRIPTTDAAYTDFSPYLAQGMTCGNCIASGENGCDWVAISCTPNGWCKFNVVPALDAHTTAVNLYYKSRRKAPKDLYVTDGTNADTSEEGSGVEGGGENVEMAKDVSVNSVHVDGADGIGMFSSGKKRPKVVPPNMTVIEENAPEMVNPAVVQDANLLQKSDAIPNQIKKNAEMRYTLGPWYVPNRADAHNEWTDPEELQKALWGYIENGDRDIRLQHNVEIVAGKWVEAMTWPHDVEVPMLNAETGAINKTSFPAGTVFLGVQWEPWAWDLVKKGKIRGYSIGGTGSGVNVDLPTEFDKPATFLGGSN